MMEKEPDSTPRSVAFFLLPPSQRKKRCYWHDEKALAELGEQVGGLPKITGHSSQLMREAEEKRRQLVAIGKRVERRTKGKTPKQPVDEEGLPVILNQPDSPRDTEAVDRFMKRLGKSQGIILERRTKGD